MAEKFSFRIFSNVTGDSLARWFNNILSGDVQNGPWWDEGSRKWQLDGSNNYWLLEGGKEAGMGKYTFSARGKIPSGLEELFFWRWGGEKL